MAVLGLLAAVALLGSSLGESVRESNHLAGRLARAIAAAGEADARIAALEKASADAKADRDGLREDARKDAAAILTAQSSLAATDSGLKSAAERLASLESAMAEAKATQESLREDIRKSSAAVDAMKPALDRATAALGAAGQDIAALATRIDGLKSNAEALRQDNQKNAGAIESAASAVATLRSNFGWRDLAPDARGRLIAALAKSAVNGVNLIYISGDSESHRFAMRLGAAFKAAGWSTNYVSAVYPGTLITGIVLNKADNQATQEVASALQASGLDALSADVPRPSQSFGGADEGNPVTLVVGAHALY
jgi:hypothetical protein